MKNRKNFSKKTVAVIIASIAGLFAAVVIIFCLTVSPTVTINGSPEIKLTIGEAYTEQGAKASFGFFDISNKIKASGGVDSSKPGVNTVTYTVSFLGKSDSAVRSVSVLDSELPSVFLLGSADITVQSILEYKDEGATATDNYDGDITSKIKVDVTSEEKKDENGIKYTVYEYKYSVSDSSGNTAFVSRRVTARDTEPPEIRLNGAEEINVVRGKRYNEQGAVSTDNVTEKPEIKITGFVDMSKAGVYKLTYTAYDDSGNTASVTRTVRVREPLSSPDGNADPESGSVICLTFDDGPSWGVTDKVLNVLADYNVKATFFVIDYTANEVPLLKRMVNEGHTIAIHSKSHIYSECYRSADEYMNGVYYMQEKIYADTGHTAEIIRFPGGTSNTVSRHYCKGVMTELKKRATEAGFNYVDWNVDSTDASETCRPVSTLISNTLGGLRKNRVNVVLMHDSVAKKTTPEALPEIISKAAENGYKFARLTKSVRCRHAANN